MGSRLSFPAAGARDHPPSPAFFTPLTPSLSLPVPPTQQLPGTTPNWVPLFRGLPSLAQHPDSEQAASLAHGCVDPQSNPMRTQTEAEAT